MKIIIGIFIVITITIILYFIFKGTKEETKKNTVYPNFE